MLPLLVTMGEPAGIGGEIALVAWMRRGEGIPPFGLIDCPDRLRRLAERLGWSVPIQPITEPGEVARVWPAALPVLVEPLDHPVIPGRPDPASAPAVTRAITRAVAWAMSGAAGAVVTNPIQKETLIRAGFRHPGHTEFLADLATRAENRGGAPGSPIRPVMMLVSPALRVVPVTIHMALAEVLTRLTPDLIVETGLITAAALRQDFGLAAPRLVVAGLNPHAGEGGAFGREEIEIIAPAIRRLVAAGIDVRGPLPADTLFHPAARARYDVALGMYHDQALIPLKTLDFDGGVNVTLGLPFIRTSPDHGTALDRAGTGTASPTSLIAALRLAGEMVCARAARAPTGTA